MSRSGVKTAVGLFVVIAHFVIIVTVFVVYFLGWFGFDEMTTTLGLTAPMFAIYISAIISHIIKNQSALKQGREKVNKAFVFIAFLLPALFSLSLLGMVILKAANLGFSSFEQFKITLSVVEGAFGVYAGQLLSSLFEIDSKHQPER